MEELKNDLREKTSGWHSVIELPDLLISDYMASVPNEIDLTTEEALITSPANAKSLNLKRNGMLRCVVNHEKSLLADLGVLQINLVWAESRKTMERIGQEIEDLVPAESADFEETYHNLAMRILEEKSKVEEVALGTRIPVFFRQSNGQGFLFQLDGISLNMFDIKCLKAYFCEPEHPPALALAKVIRAIKQQISEYIRISTPSSVVVNEKVFQICCLAHLINLSCEVTDKNEPVISMIPSRWPDIFENHASQFDKLDLSNLGLTSFDVPPVFRPHIAELNLANNRLASLNEELLQALTSLLKLDLTNAFEPKVRFDLKHLRQLEELSLTLPECFESENLTNSTLRKLSLYAAPASGGHDSSQCVKLVDTLERTRRNSKISDLKLSGFKFDAGQLRRLSDAFRRPGWPLTGLDLSNNAIEAIPESFFERLEHLTTLDISQNCIASLPESLFSKMLRLEKLDLSGNAISEWPADILSRGLGHSLRILNLSNNRLTEIGPMLLLDLTSLNLSHNPIEAIKSQVFEGRPIRKLQTLDLSHCRLKSIDMRLVDALNFLESLDLSNNRIDSILFSVPGLDTPLVVNAARLENHELDLLRQHWAHRSSYIAHLNLSNNQLAEFNLACFQNMFMLQEIQLSNNKLERIGNQSERPRPARYGSKLKKIDLSNNRLTTLDDDFFHPFPGLTAVDLSSNALELTIDENTFPSKSLGELQLAENKAIVIRASAWHRFKDLTGILKEWKEPDDKSAKSQATATA